MFLQDAAEAILEKENLGKGDPVEKGYVSVMRLDKRGEVAGDTVVTRETFVAFAEQNGSIISVYQVLECGACRRRASNGVEGGGESTSITMARALYACLRSSTVHDRSVGASDRLSCNPA